MIAYVSGTLVEKKPTEALVDVQGIGYQLFISMTCYDSLPPAGKPIRLWTHHYIREDAATLFGFTNRNEQTLFELLISVSRVGPKLAMAILSAMQPNEIQTAIVSEDIPRLSSISGLGKKTAERLILELRDKVSKLEGFTGGTISAGGGVGYEAQTQARHDALSALQTLGISRAMAEKNIRIVLRKNQGLQSSDEILKLALREMG